MIIRPYVPDTDFGIIKNWAADERTHSLWCAGRTGYPLGRESFDRLLEEIYEKHGDIPYIAENGAGEPVGFFCYGLNSDTKEGMLKFVIVSPEHRGKGYGREMLSLAAENALENGGAEAVRLCVFSVNEAAIKCYKSAGFEEISTAENAFAYKDEMWGRIGMIKRK